MDVTNIIFILLNNVHQKRTYFIHFYRISVNLDVQIWEGAYVWYSRSKNIVLVENRDSGNNRSPSCVYLSKTITQYGLYCADISLVFFCRKAISL